MKKQLFFKNRRSDSPRYTLSPIAPDAIYKNEKYERCLICNSPTDIPKDMDISLRERYIEGAGQICEKCWRKMRAVEEEIRSINY